MKEHRTLRIGLTTESIYRLLIFINILGVYFLDDIKGIGTISKLLMLLLIVYGLLLKLPALPYKVNLTVVVALIFMVYGFSLDEYQEGFWSSLLGANVQTAVSVTLATLVGLVVYLYGDTKQKRYQLIHDISTTGVLLAMFTVAVCGIRVFAGLHATGMTSYLAIYGLQSNQMGVCFGISSLAAFFLFYIEKDRRSLISMVVNVLFTFLTGSRGALIYLAVGGTVIYILSGKKYKVLFRIILIGLLACAVYYALMNVPVLYNLVGRRIESLLDVLRGGTGTDTTQTRVNMITRGLALFRQKPWVGHGFNAFSHYYAMITGTATYSHNNYVELLVTGGIAFLSMFYLRYVIVIKRLLVQIKKNKEAVLMLALLLSVLAADIAIVSYYYRIYYIVFGMTMACAYQRKTEANYVEGKGEQND